LLREIAQIATCIPNFVILKKGLLVMDFGPPSFGGPRRAPSAPRPKRAAALMVVPCGMNSTRRTLFRSQETVVMIFRVDNVCLNFLGLVLKAIEDDATLATDACSQG
jgi:hypothetical protein